MSLPLAARFRAIITGPLNGASNASDNRQNAYQGYGAGHRLHDLAGSKRKTENDDVGPSNPKTPRATGSRESTISYRSREELLRALQARFRQGPHVDFHGMYEMMDPGSTHKARIQIMANEIWRATGYRFTVKDHPHFINGHKTRFWCSQDEAHRSKSSRAARRAQGDLYKPRQSSSGESLAKTRFPCQSRLLVSSRETNTDGWLMVTVRMHHQVAHEPYIDLNLPPDMAQGVLDNYWWIAPPGTPEATTTKATTRIVDPSLPMTIQQTYNQPMVEEQTPPEQDSYDDISSEFPQEPIPLHQPPHQVVLQRHENRQPPPRPPPAGPPPTPPSEPRPQLHLAQTVGQPLSLPPTNIYHRRMSAHIRNLREFCDGLEYQLQFDDYRMLDVLEREGGPFLELVADCLKKEGRLVPPDQSSSSSSTLGVVGPIPPTGRPTAAAPQMMNGMVVPREYERNPGINPRALGR